MAFSALGPFAMHLIIPAITPIQMEFGITASTAALLISATLWGIALSTLFFGVLADRFGRRPMLMGGMALVIIGRVVQGIGGATGIVISRAVIRDIYPREKGTSVLAYVTMAVMIAPILAPSFAGIIVEHFDWRRVFDVAAILGIGIFIWLLKTFPETLDDPIPLPNLGALLRAYVGVLREPVFLLYSLVGTFIMTSFFSMMSGAPFVADLVWSIGRDELGYYLGLGGLGMMIGTFVTARIAERVDNNRLMLIGLGFIALSTGAIVVLQAVGLSYAYTFFGPMVMTGFGAGLCLPTSTTGALAIVPRMAGTASGMMTFLQFLVAGIAAQAVGYFDHTSPWPVTGFMVAATCFAIVCALLAIGLSRRVALAE